MLNIGDKVSITRYIYGKQVKVSGFEVLEYDDGLLKVSRENIAVEEGDADLGYAIYNMHSNGFICVEEGDGEDVGEKYEIRPALSPQVKTLLRYKSPLTIPEIASELDAKESSVRGALSGGSGKDFIKVGREKPSKWGLNAGAEEDTYR